MRIENEFSVRTGPDETWTWLLDVERIAPCMPGAEITEHVDERTWKGKVNMKFGPVAMSFAGQVVMEERDDTARRVKLVAKGTEQKGKGAANAVVTSWLEPTDDGGTHVKMQADITLSGAVAQLSRGLLPEVSRQLTGRFAECLEASMGAAAAPAEAAPEEAPAPAEAAPEEAPAPAAAPAAPAAPVAAEPVGGIMLGLKAIWAVIVRFFRRLFGGGGAAQEDELS